MSSVGDIISASSSEVLKRYAIPIQINWQLDIITRDRESNDNLLRELIFHYINYPTLEITIPYGLDINHNFNIFFDSDIDDNSDIVNHMNKGEYFRSTMSLYTDDAYLWKSSLKPPAQGNIELVGNPGTMDPFDDYTLGRNYNCKNNKETINNNG